MTELTAIAKQEIALRYWLLGRGYTMALRAMDFAQTYHTGTRKDGITPEFAHQIEIALHVRALPGLLHPEETLATVMLHDTIEDYGVSREEVRDRFGARVERATWNVTKKMPIIVDGKKIGMVERDEDELYEAMAEDEIASIVKPADRGHNQRTMPGVFTPEKQLSTCDFTESRILPMMKTARRRFPEQEPAYEILKHLLTTQIRTIRSLVPAIQEG